MKLSLISKAGANHLLTVVLSLTFIITACDKNTSHRNKPARKANPLNASNQKTDPANPTATPTPTATPDPNQPAPIPDPSKPAPNAGDNSAAPNTAAPATDKNPNVLSNEGSSNSGNPASTGSASSPPIATRAAPNGAPANNNSPVSKDDILADLNAILFELSTVYDNAWLTMTQDKSSHPANYFEMVAHKMKNFTPIITVKDGEDLTAHLQNGCSQFKLFQSVDQSQNYRRLIQVNCDTRAQTTLFTFQITAKQWNLWASKEALVEIMPQQLGFLHTIVLNPSCAINVYKEEGPIRVVKANCHQWGQEQADSDAKKRKTIILDKIIYDVYAMNVLETLGHYVDIDGNNQICLSGAKRRIAPQASEYIYAENEVLENCKPLFVSDPNTSAPPLRPGTESSENTMEVKRPRAKKLPTQTEEVKQLEAIDPVTGEVIHDELPVDEKSGKDGDTGTSVEIMEMQPIDESNETPNESPAEANEEVTSLSPRAAPVAPAPITPALNEQSAQSETLPAVLDDGSQQLDFSSTLPTDSTDSTDFNLGSEEP